MLHVVRGFVLLLLMALGQAEKALALACEPPEPSYSEGVSRHAGHTHCASQHTDGQQPGSDQSGAPHHEVPGPSGSHEGPSCAAMLSCGGAMALPSLPVAFLPTSSATAPLPAVNLPASSRAETPGSPPPRA